MGSWSVTDLADHNSVHRSPKSQILINSNPQAELGGQLINNINVKHRGLSYTAKKFAFEIGNDKVSEVTFYQSSDVFVDIKYILCLRKHL